MSPGQPLGPDPRRVNDLHSLATELELLRQRAAKGRGQQMVSFSFLTRLLGLPPTNKSTIHSYLTGKSLPPPDILDQIVVALGASEEEQRDWGNAWFQVAGRSARAGGRPQRAATSGSAIESLTSRLRMTRQLRFDVTTFSAHNLDLVHQVDTIAPDHEAQIPAPSIAPGGSGANTAVALSLLGVRTCTIGAIARDWRGDLLRQGLATAGLDTSMLLTIDGDFESGHALVFADGMGQRLIYVRPGVNELLASELHRQHLHEALFDHVKNARWLHLSSFASTAERLLQQAVSLSLDDTKILSITPGALYAALGADRIAALLRRANLIFAYEQHLDLLLDRSAAAKYLTDHSLTDRLRALYKWRAEQGDVEPLMVILKRPAGLQQGELSKYLIIGTGRLDLEEISGPDTGYHRREIADATGAGDALAAGLIAGLLSGLGLAECSNLAFLMALCASSGIGARTNLPTRDELADRWRHYLPDVPIPIALGIK